MRSVLRCPYSEYTGMFNFVQQSIVLFFTIAYTVCMTVKQDTVHLGLRVPRELVDKLDRYAEREGYSRSDAARLILRRALRLIKAPGTAAAP